MTSIALVREKDLDELLRLMRGYCDFYGMTPSDEGLLAMSRALIADPRREGLQLMARGADGGAVGFATVFWTWSTLRAARAGVMNDLYVSPQGRGSGIADRLIEACVEHCRQRGDVVSLGWQTAKDNRRAQAVYERVGAERSEWVDYSLSI